MASKSSDQAHFKNLIQLLRLEKEADLLQFKEKVQAKPLNERVAEGYSWYPLILEKSGYTVGDHAFIVVKKQKALGQPHHFRAGMLVNFFSNFPDVDRPERHGVINFIDNDTMKIILNGPDIPDWSNKGLTGLDLLFDERTYREMEGALQQAMKAKNNRLAEWVQIAGGQLPASFRSKSTCALSSQLNASQNEALNHILGAEDIAIIHGPPGTGKTTTLVAAIQHLTEQESTILVCAPSNTAVDLLTERLAAAGLNVLRLGHISRVSETMLTHTLEVQLAEHPESKTIKKIKQEAADARRKARRYRRSFNQKERVERQNLFRDARELSAWANQLEQRIIGQLISGAQVICCTLTGASLNVLKDYSFRTLVIDEAAQALEPSCWIPLQKARRLIMAGDPMQLPPTVKSQEAARGGLSISLLERFLSIGIPHQLLTTQYRMHEHIMQFSNLRFYEGRLVAHTSVAQARLPGDTELPFSFIDTAGCGFEEELEPQFKSRFNPGEYHILREHLLQLSEVLTDTPDTSIGIITPYKEQALYIRRQLQEEKLLEGLSIKVNTIDGFQGQEKTIVYLSLVRSNEKGEIGFLQDYRRMNVALTRAQKKLIVIGDSATIGEDPFYRAFLDYVDQLGAYRSAWEYMQ